MKPWPHLFSLEVVLSAGSTSRTVGHHLFVLLVACLSSLDIANSIPRWELDCATGGHPPAEPCAGGYPWITWPVPSIEHFYSKMYHVPVVFSSLLRPEAKKAFWMATHLWEARTCVRFIFLDEPPTDQPYLHVHLNEDKTVCASKCVGRPDALTFGAYPCIVSLGFCRTAKYIPTIAKIIGMSLGLNPEQRRLDAAQEYEGKGPHIHVNWHSVPDPIKEIFEPRIWSYLGSRKYGYAEYDYFSLLHVPHIIDSKKLLFFCAKCHQIDAIGQATKPSAEDIRRLNDIYSCIA